MIRFAGIAMEIGGTEYIVPPISIGALEVIQDRLLAMTGKITDGPVVVDALFAALKRNYPAITREEVADLVDVGNFGEVMEAVMDVGGLKRREVERTAPGEPMAA